ncbi:MAG: DUF2244 domain-containing protein [Acetobacteraceae bacterium]|nr:DUF2244 domain-containing protein [Acetobacteraceae bacterium]
MTAMPAEYQSPILFEAVITPHRSLGRRGLRILMGALAMLSALVALGLWLAGAWPVIGFTGIEVVLALWLLKRHASIEGESEVLILSDDGLRIIRSKRRTRSEMQVPVGWLRSSLEERPGRAPALMLRGIGTTVEVATSLGEEEKRDLAVSLAAALQRQRNPVFDNPQLREG